MRNQFVYIPTKSNIKIKKKNCHHYRISKQIGSYYSHTNRSQKTPLNTKKYFITY